jgi:hypothetical protein
MQSANGKMKRREAVGKRRWEIDERQCKMKNVN